MSKLVIVESPAKSKKIAQFLSKEYKVDSCVGHIRDLPRGKSDAPAAIKDKPWADYGVDIENGFKPYYVTIRGKGKVITELRKKLKDADELLLATDEDREGESISWHLVEALNPKVPVKRMVFNEITKTAVVEALEHTRPIDMDLVQAQETRRILDRLYGYALSPLLWRKIGGNLSAGRVQSPAVRLVVMRERERRAFRSGTYWDMTATLEKGAEFEAKLKAIQGKAIATSKDFDKDTGKISADKDVVLLEEAQAKELQARLPGSTWKVSDVQSRSGTSKPRPPYITSTMQQDGINRLNMSAKNVMSTAQRLYENGFITYMRTDSTALSEEAIKGATAAIRESYGADYLADAPRTYEGKKTKGAQEAHEAIRPAGSSFAHPDKSGLRGADLALYRLIWKRTLASQMKDERYTQTTATIDVDEATFSATGRKVDFPGWRIVYRGEDAEDRTLPPLAVGDTPDCKSLEAEGHETQPPARYTEAKLVQALEEAGIGRPSTYAAIMDNIQQKGYVVLKGKALVPSFTAFAVIGFLEKYFPDLVDLEFTAGMEEKLDLIAAGEADWAEYLRHFFLGPAGLQAEIEERMENVDPQEARVVDIEGLPYTVRIGRFGPYVEAEHDGETVTASIREDITLDELNEDYLATVIQKKAAGPTSIGKFPETGENIFVFEGRFGPYYQLGDGSGDEKPKRASLPKGRGLDGADLDEAIWLLSLPKQLGEHPEGGKVEANEGRFGPYVAHHKPGASKPEYRSLKKEDDLKTITLERALELLSEPKGGRRGATVLKELGDHPDGGAVQILDGRYGPYVKHEKTNATIPKGEDPDKLTMEQAVELIKEKKAKGPVKKRRSRKK